MMTSQGMWRNLLLSGVFFSALMAQSSSALAAINIGYIESFEAASIPAIYTTPATSKAWSIDSSYAAQGSNSLRSAPILDNESSSIVLTSDFGDGAIKVMTRVDADYSDKLYIILDNDEANAAIVVTNYRWRLVTIPVTAGVHTIEFRYQKNNGYSTGADAAWIDFVRFVPATPIGATAGNILVSSNGKIYEYDVNGVEEAEITTSATSYSHFGDLTRNNRGDVVSLWVDFSSTPTFLDAHVYDPLNSLWAATPILLKPAQSVVRDQASVRLTAYDNTILLTSTISVEGSGGIFQYNFDSGQLAQYFATSEFDSINLGLDGNLYTLDGYSSTRTVHVIDPTSMIEINSFPLPAIAANMTVKSVTANAQGVVFAAIYYDAVDLIKFDPNVANSAVTLSGPDFDADYIDIDIRQDGHLVASGRQGEILVSDENFSFTRQFIASDDLYPGNTYVSFARDPLVDKDGDGMSDGWEAKYSTNGNLDPAIDLDNDGLTNLQEYTSHTDPTVADSDSDGLNDGDEVNTQHTDPNNPDSDGDGLMDGEEVTLQTSPLNPDSDGDNLNDGDEVNLYHSDPNNVDSDGDGLNDGDEVNLYHSSPTMVDSDNDGLPDPYEVAYPSILNPSDATDAAKDPDTDNLTNLAEFQNATDPTASDSDKDNLNDGMEVLTYGTDPNNPDSDGDTLSDGDEVINLGTDPNKLDTDGDGLNDNVDPYPLDKNNNANLDSDGDGLSDSDETNIYHTDPNNADSDGDGLNDGEEVLTQHTDPNNSDSDGDGLSDGDEVNTYHTNPMLSDSDSDGLSDSAEINTHHTNPNLGDSDGDGLNDSSEINTHFTDPMNADSDGDGLNDGDEINTHLTNPNNSDSDSDGLNDGQEVNVYHTNPNNADTDGDGISDGSEVTNGSDPLVAENSGNGNPGNPGENPATPNSSKKDDTSGVGANGPLFLGLLALLLLLKFRNIATRGRSYSSSCS